MALDERVVVLLGDISVFGFRNAFQQYPKRIYNIGICEQAMTSLSAGLAREGLIPIIHSIAPFLVERAMEQLKIDLCYQRLKVNVVSVGGSYDYAALGSTHHCPADVALLRTLPGMDIVIPGTPEEFDRLFRVAYANKRPTYFRLSERRNPLGYEVKFGCAEVIRRGNLATIIAVGSTLAAVMEAVSGLDVTVLYYTTVAPFDGDTLAENCQSDKIVLVEPYYSGVLNADILSALRHSKVLIKNIGVPHRFLTNYGRAEQHDEVIGLTPQNIRMLVKEVIHA